MVTSLQRLGHTVPFQSATAPVEIAFCQPDYSEWSNPDAFHIQYTPWESTEIDEQWVEAFNLADEVWTPSDLVAGWYKEAGVKVPIRVYEHGIDPMYRPIRRRSKDRINFLHVGEPAERKGGQMTLEAFREVFGDREDVHLTIKAWQSSTVRVFDRKHQSIIGLPNTYNNVTTIFNNCSEVEMVYIFQRNDVLVYPSWGEGFGLIPLQSLAQAMPTICTEVWAPYREYLLPELSLGSTLTDSPWPEMHKGKMFKPSYEDLCNSLRWVSENFENASGRAYRNAYKVKEHYDWDTLTENIFKPIVERFG